MRADEPKTRVTISRWAGVVVQDFMRDSVLTECSVICRVICWAFGVRYGSSVWDKSRVKVTPDPKCSPSDRGNLGTAPGTTQA